MPFTPWVPTVGNSPVPLSLASGGTGLAAASGAAAAAALTAMPIQAETALAGYTLVNGTGTVVSWTAPNDGALHRFLILGTLAVSVATTGGSISEVWTTPNGTASGTGIALFTATKAVGVFQASVNGHAQAGTTVTIQQQTAMTAGTAVMWVTIFGF